MGIPWSVGLRQQRVMAGRSCGALLVRSGSSGSVVDSLTPALTRSFLHAEQAERRAVALIDQVAQEPQLVLDGERPRHEFCCAHRLNLRPAFFFAMSSAVTHGTPFRLLDSFSAARSSMTISFGHSIGPEVSAGR